MASNQPSFCYRSTAIISAVASCGHDLRGFSLFCIALKLLTIGVWYDVKPDCDPTPLSPSTLQSKAFLLENPLLSKKLEAAVVEALAAGDSHIDAAATGGDVPSDPASLIASSETSSTAAGTTNADASSLSAGPGGAASSSSPEGVSTDEEKEKAVEPEGVLLEPGVGSVDELFESDVFAKEAGSRSRDKKERANET